MNLRDLFFNPPGTRDRERDRQRSTVVLFCCILLAAACIALAAIKPAACELAGSDVPRFCVD